MKVVLHIGAPKTGSSAIQFFLYENRERLEKHGFYYPAHNFDENKVSGGHAQFGAAIANNELEKAEQQLAEWRAEAERKGCALLLSSEAFYRRPQRVAALFSEFDVSVLAYFRHPLESLVSNHNQSIKRHYSTQTLDDFLLKQVGVNNRGVSGQVFFEWHKYFGADRVSVRPYINDGFVRQRIELDFLQRLAITGWSARRFKLSKARINTSYTQGALELKRLLNGLLNEQDPRESRLVDRALQAFSDRQNNRQLPPPQVISDSVFSSITERYQPSLLKAREHLLESCPSSFLQPQSVVALHQERSSNALAAVLDAYRELSNELPELLASLQQRLLLKLQQQRGQDDADALPYALLKLGEVMGLPIPEPKLERPLPTEAVTTFLSPDAGRADYLGEIGKWLERHDQTSVALKVVEHAITVAEQEKASQPLKKSLQRQLKRYQQRLDAINSERENDVSNDTDPS